MPKYQTAKANLIFTRDDILDPVQDYGQTVQFCELDIVAPADPQSGIPAQRRLRCRSVRGFVKVDTGEELRVNEGLGINASGYTAYLYGGDVKWEQITQHSMIAWEKATYHLYIIQSHGDHESGIWHEMRLLRAQSSGSVDQPDEIIETTPDAPISLEIPVAERDILFQP